MRKDIFLLFVSACLATVLFAQQKKISFQGAAQVGLLEGENGSAFQLGAMGGIRSNTWTASLGTGLDYYAVRSIPVYLNVQKNVFSSNKTPFVFAGAGHHFLWLPKLYNDDIWPGWGYTRQSKGGLYYHAGIGYQLPALKSASLFFAAGFSEKQYEEENIQVHPCLIGPCPEYKEKMSRRLRRVSITTGLRF